MAERVCVCVKWIYGSVWFTNLFKGIENGIGMECFPNSVYVWLVNIRNELECLLNGTTKLPLPVFHFPNPNLHSYSSTPPSINATDYTFLIDLIRLTTFRSMLSIITHCPNLSSLQLIYMRRWTGLCSIICFSSRERHQRSLILTLVLLFDGFRWFQFTLTPIVVQSVYQ